MYNITLIPGDGIGPEITAAAQLAIAATGVKINWEVVEAGAKCIATDGVPLPDNVVAAIQKNKIALKGPITTPIGTGFRSVNVALRKQLELFANLRPVRTIPGIKSKYANIDLIIVREATEGLYAGIERQIDKDTAESIKRVTRAASERIAKFAFEYAVTEQRNKVTVVTKANICKLSDGLFLEAARAVAKQYPAITYEELLIDNVCMQLVMVPELFDVLLLPNLYGDIVSDLAAGLIGGLGVAPGANIGNEFAVFEAAHGSAPQLAGLNQANPIAIILSSVMLLKYLGETAAANKLHSAVCQVILEAKHLTPDLGGTASTMQLAEAIAIRLSSFSTN